MESALWYEALRVCQIFEREDRYVARVYCKLELSNTIQALTKFKIITKVEAQDKRIEWGNSVSGPFRAILPFKNGKFPSMPASLVANLPLEEENDPEMSLTNGDGMSNCFIVAFPLFPVRTDKILVVPECVSRGQAALSQESLATVKNLHAKVLVRKHLHEKNQDLDRSDNVAAAERGDIYDLVKSTSEEHGSKQADRLGRLDIPNLK